MLETELKRKLLAIVAVELVLVLAAGGIGLSTISNEIETFRHFVTKDAAFQDAVSELLINELQQRRYEKGYFLSFGEPEWQKEYMQDFQKLSSDFESQIGILDSLTTGEDPHLTGEVRAKVAGLAQAHRDYVREFLAVVNQTKADPSLTPQAADDLLEDNRKGLPDMERDVRELMAAANRIQETVARESIEDGDRARTLILATLLGAVILALLLGSWLARSIYLAFLRERLQTVSRQT